MDNNRNMCLIRMASMEESLNAMAHLHDLDLGGRYFNFFDNNCSKYPLDQCKYHLLNQRFN